MGVRIVADSACDLPPGVAEDLGITVVPVHIHFGDEVYRDGVDLTTDRFYERLRTNSTLPKTSAPSPGVFAEVYRRLAEEADGIASIHVSDNLSATLDAARNGREDVRCPVALIDSETASTACGLLVIMAAKAARDGASLPEIESLVRDAVPRTITYGVFSTLEYLYRGGRIGRAQAFLGSILKLSPILAISRGEVVPVARVRTRPRAVDKLCEILFSSGEPEEMAVMRTTDPADAEDLARRLAPLCPPERMYRACIGPAIATYVGPDAVGMAVVWKGS
jgi:DegV family protein with EDD domain